MTYAALIVVCIVGAVLQSSIGFGFPIFAMIFISMLFPFQTATTITQAAGILGVGYFFFRYIRQVRWRVLAPFILSAIPVGMLCTLVSDKLDVSLLKIYLGVVLVLIALFFTQVRDNEWVERAFKGLRPAVVALIVVPCLTTARSIKLTKLQLIIPVAAALLIWQVGVSPAWIILAAIAGGLYYGLKIKKI